MRKEEITMKSLYSNTSWLGLLGVCVFVLLLTMTFSHSYEKTMHDIMVIITAEFFFEFLILRRCRQTY